MLYHLLAQFVTQLVPRSNLGLADQLKLTWTANESSMFLLESHSESWKNNRGLLLDMNFYEWLCILHRFNKQTALEKLHP